MNIFLNNTFFYSFEVFYRYNIHNIKNGAGKNTANIISRAGINIICSQLEMVSGLAVLVACCMQDHCPQAANNGSGSRPQLPSKPTSAPQHFAPK